MSDRAKPVRLYRKFSTTVQPIADKVPVPEISGTCTDAEPFALQVQDDSMHPEFDRGCIVVVDPTGHATDGAYVIADIAQLTDSPVADTATHRGAFTRSSPATVSGLVLRQLKQYANGWMLQALQPGFPAQPLAGLHTLIGVVVQRAGKRRSYFKRYD